MKLGLLFALCSLLLGLVGACRGGWRLALLWPAASFALVALGYLGLGPRVFGKRPDGTLSPAAAVVLLPYLAMTAIVWRLTRLMIRKPAMHELVPGFWIGRRLLPRELPPDTDVVVDLTAEFAEPRGVRSVGSYISVPMLDAAAGKVGQVVELARRLAAMQGKQVFLHCAQGHGRTGLVAAAYLLAAGKCRDAREAIAFTQSIRPGVRLNREQRRVLDEVANTLLDNVSCEAARGS